jgi:hypothetical protein
MRVKCIANTGKNLFKRTLAKTHLITSIFSPLEIGDYYTVYGIDLWDGNLHYLVVDRYKGLEQNPSLYPAELFEVVDNRVPQEWYFSFLGTEDENEAVWGYKEFVLDVKHHEYLYEREENALKIFFQRKLQMDESFTE